MDTITEEVINQQMAYIIGRIKELPPEYLSQPSWKDIAVLDVLKDIAKSLRQLSGRAGTGG